MNKSYVFSSGYNYYPELEDNIMDSIFKQYERVLIESLITSFGLDFIIKDRYGGDVDTLNNVGKIGKEEQMTYKNIDNLNDYNNRGDYKSKDYHSNKTYIEKNREISYKKREGSLVDEYTLKIIPKNGKSDLDHVISAKEIHDDSKRVLSGLSGIDLANSNENLKVTNPHTNRTKKADSMEQFLNKYGNEYSEVQKSNMREKDINARKSYETKLEKAYYSSSKFKNDVVAAAKDVGIKMGFKQVLGFVFAEVWFSVKEEFNNLRDPFNFTELFVTINNGISNGFEKAKEKYKELLDKFQDGVVAGAFSSLTTTLCNIFVTTSQNTVKIIRQTYASLVQAAKILFLNPENLPFGKRMCAVVKILATGASIVVGTIVSDAIGKTTIGTMSTIGDVIKNFCGTLVTGIMSCSLLYFFDRSDIMKKLISTLDKIHTLSTDVNYFYKQAEYFERYAANLMKIDLKKFQEETKMYYSFALNIETVKDEKELNYMLKNILSTIGVQIPWQDNFDSFMSNKNTILVFE